MKQTMKRQWADWWKCGRMPKDPTWGWNFHFTVFLLFLFFFFHFSAAPFYAGPYIVAVLVATLSVFCLQFSVCQYFLFFFFVFQWIEWGTHYLHTATPPTAHFRPLWPAMNRLSSNANRFTVSYANFLSFFCSSYNLRFSLLFLFFYAVVCLFHRTWHLVDVRAFLSICPDVCSRH